MDRFKIGDLVRVKDGTHEDGMPECRVAMVIESVEHYRGEVFRVLFLGTDTPMSFHQMFLEPFTTR